MRRRIAVVTAGILAISIGAATLRAQFTVFDPTNYAEAILEVEQLIRQYEFLLQQALRVPVDIASRYHAYSRAWDLHDLGALYADPLLRALNDGDVTGAAYRGLVDPLDVPTDVVARMSPTLQHRLADQYGAIELQDSVSRLAVDQTGSARTDGPLTLQAVNNVEHDIDNPADAFQSQTALLEKINAAFAVGLRIEEQTNQFQLTALEQLLVDNTRKRDAEARLMNATIYQWRFGLTYGQDLFRATAADLETWRPF
jgi:hypothetical protein